MRKRKGTEIDYLLVKARLTKARQINGFNLRMGAERLGYKTPSALQKMENPEEKRTPQPELIILASGVYGVTMDYLYGASDYPEGDIESTNRIAILKSIRLGIEEHTKRIAIEACSIARNTLPYRRMLDELILSASKAVMGFDLVRERDKQALEELKAGNRLFTSIGGLREKLDEQQKTLERERRIREIKMNADAPPKDYPLLNDLFNEAVDFEEKDKHHKLSEALK